MSVFPKYDRYKDSGVEWLGEIPEHWEPFRAKHVFRNVSEKGFPDEPLLSATQDRGVVPRDQLEQRVVMPVGQLQTFKLVRENDFVISLRSFQGGIEHCAYQGLVSPAYTVLRLQRDVNPRFLRHLLKASNFISELNISVTGIRQGKNIDYGDFAESILPIPPEPEQDRIVTFLDRKTAEIDALIAKKQRQIELLDEQKAILINRAVTRGLNPNAKLKPSGIEWIGKIPEGWHLTRLKHVTNRIGDGLHGTPDYDVSSDIFFINGNNLQSGSIAVSESTRTVSEKVLRNHFSDFDSSTVFISINGTLGNAAIYGGEKIMLGKSAAYIKCAEAIEPQFAYFVTTTIPYVRYYHREASGTTIHNLSLATLRGLPVPLPPLPQQREILEHCGQIVRDHSKATASAARQIENLREYLSTLIAHAVTGRIKVP